VGVFVQEGFDAFRFLGGDNEADVVVLAESPHDFGVLIGRGIGLFLTG
jgi:hypothetical protein